MPLRLALMLASALALALTFGGVRAQTLGASASTLGPVVTTDQVRAELVAHAPDGVGPGKSLWLGLRIDHKPHWHTYWKNPGDSGLPTTLTWTLPAGLAAGDIAWPTPKKLPVGPLMNYGYEGALLLPVPVTVTSLPPALPGAKLEIKLAAQWLVCKEVCIPEEGQFSLSLPVQATTAAHSALFDAAVKAQPVEHPAAMAGKPSTAAGAGASVATAQVDGQALSISVAAMPAAWQGKPVDVFVEAAGVVAHAMKPTQAWRGDTLQTSLPLSSERYESPAQMHAVLTSPAVPGALRVGFDIKGDWPALAPAGAGAAAVASTGVAAGLGSSGAAAGMAQAPAASTMGLVAALLSALVGGLLLNLMPCVLPVLSLKILGLTHDGGRGAQHRVASGVAYTLGVVGSFVALALMLLALRAGGEAVGWGFQLQSPWVVAALAGLFTLIGPNLAGVFEWSLVLPGDFAAKQLKHPWLDAALTGVLAVAVAAPCTAPFMGAALGYAVQLPAAQALLVFAALGVGMALPFLLISIVPSLSRWLPRPGPWMPRFKTLMAFPMFATVVWLAWVLGQQSGIDAVAALLAMLVLLALVAWLFGLRRQSKVAAVGMVVSALALVALGSWSWPLIGQTQTVGTNATTGASTTATLDATATWQPWSADAVAQHVAAGRTVFVDFTAAWCVTCQVNKRTTLTDARVLEAMKAKGIVALRADWTRRDAAIAAELARLQRSGVPVYAIYRAGQAPVVLPEVLTPEIVLTALN